MKTTAALLLAAALLAAGLALAMPAHAQTVVEVEWFDRPRLACDGFEEPEVDCSYRWRFTLQMERAPFEDAPWLRLLGRIEVLSRRSESENLHFDPLKSDLGGGVVLAHGPWRLTWLLSSRHCMDEGCEPEPYNSLIVRWQP